MGALRTRWRHLGRRVNVSASTAIAPTPAGKTIKKRPAWATLTCVGLKEGARWRVYGCDRGAHLAAIAPTPVGKMVNRIGVGDVDAQWFRRASNPHLPDRCGRSAVLSYGTVLPAHTAHPMGVHAHGLGWWDGHPATPAPSARPVCAVARRRDRPRVHGAHADCLDSPRALCRSNRIRTGGLPLRRRTLSPLSYGTLVAFPLGHTMRPRVGHPSDWRDSNPRPPGPQPGALPTAPQSVGRFSRPAGTARPCGSRVTEERVRPVARMRRSCRIRVVPSTGFEPATPTFGRWRSIL